MHAGEILADPVDLTPLLGVERVGRLVEIEERFEAAQRIETGLLLGLRRRLPRLGGGGLLGRAATFLGLRRRGRKRDLGCRLATQAGQGQNQRTDQQPLARKSHIPLRSTPCRFR